MADYGNKQVKEIPVNGGAPLIVGSGYSFIFGVAVDVANNVFVTDYGNNAVKEIKPIGGYYINPALPAGLNFNSTTGAITGTALAASPATDYTVTAYNSFGGNSAIVNIKVINSAYLSALSLSAAPISPAFKTTTLAYTASVSNAITSTTITPTASDALATIKVNGVAVATGMPSTAIPLAVGPNIINTVVTSVDGLATKTYAVTVTRAPSANAAISVLKLTPKTTLTLTGSGSGVNNYTTQVPFSETSLTVAPTAQDATASITVNGMAVASATDSQPIPLNVGDNVITIVCTAQDGVTSRAYIITATRAGSPIATLDNLAISAGVLTPVFASATTSYTSIVPYATTSVKITPTVTDANATVKVNGTTVASGTTSASLPLAVGDNAITTVVTAQDGTTTKTYTVTVTRAAAGLSTNAAISVLKLNPKTTLTLTGSGSGVNNYSTQVPFSETSLTVAPTAQDANASITVNGMAVVSATESQAIPLNVGDNLITIVCTAQDGATTRSYIITATRTVSTIATLNNLAISTSILNPAFAQATTGYTDIVPYATSSVKITPTVTDANSTVKVNGTTVASGTASGALPLSVGDNTITTIVTAQDGATTKTYTVTVTRAASGLSTNAAISVLKLTPKTTLVLASSGSGVNNYTTQVPFGETNLTVTPTAQDAHATITVNGIAVASATESQAIPLNVGDNVITIVCTAQDGATTRSYIITATRAASGMAMKYDEPAGTPILAGGITVHQGLSPNADGDNDVLIIDGIANYPDNTLQIMSRSGALVYKAQGYNNVTKAFDGHSSTSGKLQQAGTYFYSLEYKDGNEIKHKTGFIVLKF